MIILDLARNCLAKWRLKKKCDSIVNSNHSSISIPSTVKDMRDRHFSMTESFLCDFVNNDFRDYITTWESYQPRMTESPYFVLSDDKYLFALAFGNYIDVPKTYAIIDNGEIQPITKYVGEVDWYRFIVECGGAVIKDRCGCDGFGVFVLNPVREKLYCKGKCISEDELQKIIGSHKKGIIQSIVKQGDFENAFFPDSVNTIRIISVRKKDSIEHEIIGAIQRIGTKRSAPVDNFSQGGGTALIDLETGELGAMTASFAVDENGNRQFFDYHPDTGVRIKGKVVPNWNGLKSLISDITKCLPYFECIAWDIVVKDDGFALIETNMKSSLNIFQIHKGMRNTILGEKYREHGWLVDQNLIEKE